MNVTHYNNVTHLVALCKSALVSFFFFLHVCVCFLILHHRWSSGAPGCSPSCGIWGESVSTNLWKDRVWKSENTCGCPSAIIIMNTSNALKTFIFHTYSPLPVVEKSTLIVYLSPSRSRSKVSAELRRVCSACGGEYKNSWGDKWVCLCLYENVAFASPEG